MLAVTGDSGVSAEAVAGPEAVVAERAGRVSRRAGRVLWVLLGLVVASVTPCRGRHRRAGVACLTPAVGWGT